MAEILRYVDPNSTTGGDGTTNALTGAARAYISLNAWEAAQQQDLTDGAGDTARVVCSSDDAGSTHAADTTAVVISGWTTSATSYITIEAASSHGGKWNDNIYRLNVQDALSITISEEYVRLIGIQVAHHTLTATNYVIRVLTIAAGGSAITISKCIVLMSGGDATYISKALSVSDADATVNVINTLMYRPSANATTGNTALHVELGNANIYSCTIVGGYRAFRREGLGTVVAKNCYVKVITTSAAYFGTITKTNCASSDATADGTAPQINIALNTTNFTNVSAGSEDFHLPVGSALIVVGTDTSGDTAPLDFTDDIDGVTRTGTWDIGADEYVAAAAAGHPTMARWGGVPYMTLGRRKW